MFKDPWVIVLDMPTSVKGICYLDADGNPCIAVNARITREEQIKAYRHEMNHIKRGDMDNPDYMEYGS